MVARSTDGSGHHCAATAAPAGRPGLVPVSTVRYRAPLPTPLSRAADISRQFSLVRRLATRGAGVASSRWAQRTGGRGRGQKAYNGTLHDGKH